MEPLTEKQQNVLRFVETRLGDQDPPSQREIARHLGLTQTAVRQRIRYLKNKGYLLDSGGHRGLRLSEAYKDQSKRTHGIPIVGRVAAGHPILAEEHIEGHLHLQEVFAAGEGVFSLRVTGDSMIDDGILDGDYVLVQPAEAIENGRIGVVLVEDEVTVKRVYRQKGRIVLKPANRQGGYEPMSFRPSDRGIRIVGRVIGCIRTQIR